VATMSAAVRCVGDRVLVHSSRGGHPQVGKDCCCRGSGDRLLVRSKVEALAWWRWLLLSMRW
jgi:hypothetical protein